MSDQRPISDRPGAGLANGSATNEASATAPLASGSSARDSVITDASATAPAAGELGG